MQDRHAVADLGVDQRAHRADDGVAADRRAALELGERLDHGVAADAHRGVDPGRAGVDDRHAAAHVLLEDAALGDLLGVGEVDAVVDAVREVGVADGVRRDRPAGVAHGGQHVGQVELALGVVGVERRQRGDQRAAVERVDAGVDLADLELLGGRVAGRLGLGHAQDRAVAVADDAAVGARARRAPSSPSSPRRRAASCASTRASIASAVSSATSPLMTTTVAVGSSSEAAAATASPVPSRLLLDRDLDAVRQMLLQPPLRVVDHDHPPGAGVARGLRPATRSAAARTADAGPSGRRSACGCPRRRRGSRRWVRARGHRSIGVRTDVFERFVLYTECRFTGGWCNGSTLGFGPSDPGSSPGPPAHSVRSACEHVFDVTWHTRYQRLVSAIAASRSFAEALRRLGMCATGNNRRTLKQLRARACGHRRSITSTRTRRRRAALLEGGAPQCRSPRSSSRTRRTRAAG